MNEMVSWKRATARRISPRYVAAPTVHRRDGIGAAMLTILLLALVLVCIMLNDWLEAEDTKTR